MTKMKKLFAVVLALAMLVTMASFSAMAEGENPVTLTVPETVTYNGAFEVVLDADETVGGMEATVTYDKAAVKLMSASFSNDVNTQVNTVLDDKKGSIKVVALGCDVTFEFAALSTTEKSITIGAEVKASNLDGTEYAFQGELTDAANVLKSPMPVVKGTKLRETTNIDELHLGFEGKVENLPEDFKVTEVGLIVIPTAILTNNNVNPEDFKLENDDLSEKIAYATLTGDDAVAFTAKAFVGYIKDTASVELMGKSFTARYYITIDDSDEKIYSTNFTFDSNGEATASHGTAKKSAVKQLGMYAKQIAEKDTTLADAANNVIVNYNAEKTNASKQALVEFVFENRAKLD